MGWSRDLGTVCSAAEVGQTVDVATAQAAGRLSAEEEGRRKSLAARLVAGEVLPGGELAELSRLNDARTPRMSAEELLTVVAAERVAAEGVRVLGELGAPIFTGPVHVSLGGSSRVEQQPEAPVKGVRQTSITVTLTVTTGLGEEQPVAALDLKGKPDGGWSPG